MTMPNIVAGFHTTGVFPHDRDAVASPTGTPQDSRRRSLAERTGLSFIPLYSPLKQKTIPRDDVVFESEEMILFQRRYKEGFDLPDRRYELWKNMYHPENCSSSQDLEISDSSTIMQTSLALSTNPSSSTAVSHSNVLPHVSFLSRLLTENATTTKSSSNLPHSKSGSRVLTSEENIRNLKERERKKNEEAEEKMKKRVEKENRRIAAQEKKERERMIREQKNRDRLEKGRVQCKLNSMRVSLK